MRLPQGKMTMPTKPWIEHLIDMKGYHRSAHICKDHQWLPKEQRLVEERCPVCIKRQIEQLESQVRSLTEERDGLRAERFALNTLMFKTQVDEAVKSFRARAVKVIQARIVEFESLGSTGEAVLLTTGRIRATQEIASLIESLPLEPSQ